MDESPLELMEPLSRCFLRNTELTQATSKKHWEKFASWDVRGWNHWNNQDESASAITVFLRWYTSPGKFAMHLKDLWLKNKAKWKAKANPLPQALGKCRPCSQLQVPFCLLCHLQSRQKGTCPCQGSQREGTKTRLIQLPITLRS